MNIDKYIENTKRKTKKAKLPALSTMSPVLPDGGAGIDSFNNNSSPSMSLGEELKINDVENVKREIESQAKSFMIEKGFKEDELDRVLDIEFNESNVLLNVKIIADLTISSLQELADTLYDSIYQYDEDAYFDITTNNSITANLDIYSDTDFNENYNMISLSESRESDDIDALIDKIYKEHEELFVNLAKH